MIDLDDVERAAARIDGIAHRTPLVTSRTLDERTGALVRLKPENLQRIGAFKFRGAYNTVASLSPEERARGVVTASSGNHAQALALSAALHEIPATILMPEDAPASKAAATEGYGARIERFDRYGADREALIAEWAERDGLTVVHPYDDERIMAGQGTATLDLIAAWRARPVRARRRWWLIAAPPRSVPLVPGSRRRRRARGRDDTARSLAAVSVGCRSAGQRRRQRSQAAELTFAVMARARRRLGRSRTPRSCAPCSSRSSGSLVLASGASALAALRRQGRCAAAHRVILSAATWTCSLHDLTGIVQRRAHRDPHVRLRSHPRQRRPVVPLLAGLADRPLRNRFEEVCRTTSP